MQQNDLLAILLIKAIEEVDRTGTLIPTAERVAASRDARRGAGPPAIDEGTAHQGVALSRTARSMLALRARTLLEQIVARHPFVDTVLATAGGPAWAGAMLMLLGLLLGLMVSALDGTRHINILATGLLGLVLWNLLVYAVVFIGWTRSAAATRSPRPGLAGLLVRNGLARLTRLVARSAAFHAPLAEALRRFTRDWYDAAGSRLMASATRVFHLCAAAVGIGLIAGLYLRGIALDYQAGWESTFLDAGQAHTLLSMIYGPASWVTGIAIPDAAHLESIRWQNGAGGERAGPWIHLLAASAVLYILLPRLLLALADTIAIWRGSHRAPLPPSLGAYFRNAFSAVDGALGRGIIMILPYSYDPQARALARLRELLPAVLGENLVVDARAPVVFGDEESFLRHLGDRGGGIADVIVLLFNLAATPEEENHGAVIAGARDWLSARRPQAQLLIVVDEGPYAARMAAQGGAPARIVERRHAWRAFVAARGLSVCIVDLAPDSPPVERAEPADHAVADQIRGALWQPAAP